ncbi:hypothetical protein [Chroococcus sp. FPU101]|uniref:hypothetical protein n=1 Tax=Chroococcus sp. FPU101 TaxID=1974212 RepID=UPI001A8FF60B|nr:hypothetical protein [Chroococcus sp. FPU101]
MATDGFRVVTATGEVMGDEKIYYTPEAALTEGRRWLGACSRIAENVWLLVKSMN